jgi:dTMP kinase
MWATDGLVPNLTVLLDLDPTIGKERLDSANKRFDRLEAEAIEFHVRVRESYLEMAKAEPGRFLVVAAAKPREEIRDEIIERIEALA